MKVMLTRTFPTTRKEGFAFFMDVARYDEWTPFKVHDAADAKFAKKGDEVKVTYKLYGGIPMPGTITLDKVKLNELIEATICFPGMPPIHERFALHGTGTHAFVLEASMELANGNWWETSLQWLALLPVMVKRDLENSLDKAHGIFADRVLAKAA